MHRDRMDADLKKETGRRPIKRSALGPSELEPLGVVGQTLVAAVLAGLVFGGCSEEGGPPPNGSVDAGKSGGSDMAPPDGLPCNIADILAEHCVGCHGQPPVGGAPMALVSYQDLTAHSPLMPTQTIAQRALFRMQDVMSPMPPGPTPTVPGSEIAAFQAWISAGTPAGTCSPTMPRDMAAPMPDMANPSPDMAHSATDMARSPMDLASLPSDMMSGKNDMAEPPVDLARPPMDLSVPADMAGPHVTGLPSCTGSGVTADTLYTGTAMSACAGGGCHGGGAGGLTMTSGATLKANTVGVAARETKEVKRVAAADIDGSYIMYKLTGQQSKVGGSGNSMPPGKKLSDTELCQFILWIQEGAN